MTYPHVLYEPLKKNEKSLQIEKYSVSYVSRRGVLKGHDNIAPKGREGSAPVVFVWRAEGSKGQTHVVSPLSTLFLIPLLNFISFRVWLGFPK